MRKTYAAPTLVKSGSAVVETKGPGGNSGDFSEQAVTPGSVGFSL